MSGEPDELEERARGRVGQVLSGKWKLERLLGLGGMAAVYAGRHRNGAKAAVKVLHPELARHKDVRERFLREGYAANRVEHPGAVSVLDDDVVQGGPDDGAAYIVMELLEGEPLEARAQRQPLSERELLEVADSILEVLEAAHPRGVVHRDLKPDNLFVLQPKPGEPLKIKVLDFGLARLQLPDEARTATRHGVTLGTPAYMSPEQAAGRADEIDGRSDLFSVGAVMFRLRTGKRIHEGAHPIEVVAKMAKLPAPKIRDVDPSVSESFAAIVDRALSFERDRRYPDASSMRKDVQAALAGMTADFASTPGQLGHEHTELAPYRPSLPSRSMPERSMVARSFPFVGLLFLGLVGAFAWIILRDGSGAKSTTTTPTSESTAPSAETNDASEGEVALAEMPVEPLDADTDAEEDDDDEDDDDAGPDDAGDVDAGDLDADTDAVAEAAAPASKATPINKPTTKKKSPTKKSTTTKKKTTKKKKKK